MQPASALSRLFCYGLLVVSGVYVLINLVVDVLYVVLDPRIRY